MLQMSRRVNHVGPAAGGSGYCVVGVLACYTKIVTIAGYTESPQEQRITRPNKIWLTHQNHRFGFRKVRCD